MKGDPEDTSTEQDWLSEVGGRGDMGAQLLLESGIGLGVFSSKELLCSNVLRSMRRRGPREEENEPGWAGP